MIENYQLRASIKAYENIKASYDVTESEKDEKTG